jgi:hypothetical protein
MRQFVPAAEDAPASGPGDRRVLYWLLVAAVVAWTAYSAADLAWFAHIVDTGQTPLISDLPAGTDEPSAARAIMLGYAAARLVWWSVFALPTGLVALLIRPRA